MKLFSYHSNFTKSFSVILVYTLLLNESIPLVRAMNYENEYRMTLSSFYSSENSKLDIENSEANETSTKSAEIKKVETIEKNLTIPKVLMSTGGPGQTEIVGSTANMDNSLVDKFSGNLSYSIPLMDVEGFPIVLAYNPEIGMDQEASWVGLGWNLSIGSVNRDMRGIPDDFMGDQIVRVNKMNKNTVEGHSDGVNVFGGPSNPVSSGISGPTSSGGIHFSWGTYFNNYSGEGKTYDLGLNSTMAISPISINTSLGFSGDSQNGAGFNAGFGHGISANIGYAGFGVTGSYNEQKNLSMDSRSGVKTISHSSGWSAGLSYSSSYGTVGANFGRSKGSFRTFGVQSFIPRFLTSTYGISSFFTDAYQGSWSQNDIFFVGGGYIGTDYITEKANVVNQKAYPSYGYKNYSKGENKSDAMLDFNRDKNTNVNSETRVLSFSTPTYDMFYCSAPGLVSTYRAQRYDVVEYHDPRTATFVSNYGDQNEHNLNAGINITSGFTGGYTNTGQVFSGNDVSVTEGKLNESTRLNGVTPASAYNGNEFYIKPMGEKKIVDNSMLDNYGGSSPSLLKLWLNTSTENVDVLDIIITPGATDLGLPSSNFSMDRTENTVHIRELAINDLIRDGGIGIYESMCYDMSEGYPQTNGHVEILESDVKLGHHVVTIEAVNANGMRYVFGIPSYSYEQSEVSFSSAPINQSIYENTGLLHYPAADASESNNRGRFGAYEKTTVPAYATDYLLTEMLSADYVDRTGDGPTSDDQGNYFKVNYANPYNEADPYIWRMPLNADEGYPVAYANKNLHTDRFDDMGSYMYGQKDVWYAMSVESKNLVAFFCLEDRKDQFSAKNEHGGLDLTKPGQRIKKIMLYSRSELLLNDNPKALQVIEFEYDYSLCQDYLGNSDINNPDPNETGKLTLKSIYTYSEKTKEARSLPVEFIYGTSGTNENPDYARNSTDRWGNYKPNDPNLPNQEFPYAEQLASAKDNIQAWKLKEVRKIGGETVVFEYDTDDYAFVQDKRAMRMFNIEGMTDIGDLNALNDLTSPNVPAALNNKNTFRNPNAEYNYYNVVYFKLDEPITNVSLSDANLELRKKYLTNEDGNIPNTLYFNMYADLDNRVLSGTEGHEYVESAVKVWKSYGGGDFAGVVGSGQTHTYGFIMIEPEDINKYSDSKVMKYLNDFLELISEVFNVNISPLISQKVNPLQVASWQFARLNAPCNVYGEIDYITSVTTDFCDYHLENDNNLFGANLYKTFNNKGYGVYFDNTRSRVRLFEPDNAKVGGGSRISKVTIKDNWDAYSGEELAVYEYNYEYTTESGVPSGVASYEPQVGNNENPLYQLIAYSYEKTLLPNETAYQRDPWGEMVYPAAVVGYSDVKSALFDGTQVGSIHDSYYTLHDVPTQARRTVIQKVVAEGKDALEDDDKFITELNGFSQGFYVETSDFHGQPKRSVTYGGQGEIVSTTEVEYYDHRVADMNYVAPDGKVIPSLTPRDIDIYADSWKYSRNMLSMSRTKPISLGISLIYTGTLYIPIPLVYYNDVQNTTLYKQRIAAVTLNKVINHYAVPKNIKTTYLGSKNVAQNHYFDNKSGEVIVSSLKDEFNDDLYAMSYPAHWKYDAFDNMSWTDGAVFLNNEVSSSIGNVLTLNSIHGLELNIGDELFIKYNTGDIQTWVLTKNGNDYELITHFGNELPNIIDWNTATVKVIRTARKNRLTEQMMGITSKSAPVITTQGPDEYLEYPEEDIYSASAIEYLENKNMQCGEVNGQYEPETVINPFLNGVMGNFRMSSSLAIQEDRNSIDQTTPTSPRIRYDGEILSYQPYYKRDGAEWFSIGETGHPDNLIAGNINSWRRLGQIDEFDEFGKPIQSTDQIEVSSSVLYGMNNDLKLTPKASAVNAESNEIGFDGFEDYNYLASEGTGFSTNNFALIPDGVNSHLTSDARHSGRYSLEVNGEAAFEFPVISIKPAEAAHIISGEYQVQECDCILGFSPYIGRTYILSAWVHENTGVYPFAQSSIIVKYLNSGGSVISQESPFVPSGQVIDGWQKIEGEYTIPSGTVTIRYVLKNVEEGSITESYFDDFRTHPILAGMKSIVYDQKTLLPIAEHDGYNYAVFYNYDENNQLVRMRVETIEGIKTISESETGSYRKQ